MQHRFSLTLGIIISGAILTGLVWGTFYDPTIFKCSVVIFPFLVWLITKKDKEALLTETLTLGMAFTLLFNINDIFAFVIVGNVMFIILGVIADSCGF